MTLTLSKHLLKRQGDEQKVYSMIKDERDRAKNQI